MTPNDDSPDRERVIAEHERERGSIEEFARGEIRSYHGFVNKWLVLVYAALTVWSVYYLVKFWGGLGPGLPR
ncbi:MAG: hypothetical protein ACREJV_05215 [Candidatus Rokuibacteriota bacterium]